MIRTNEELTKVLPKKKYFENWDWIFKCDCATPEKIAKSALCQQCWRRIKNVE